jgi:hypothetical protein
MSKAVVKAVLGHAIQSIVESGADATTIANFTLGLQSKLESLLSEIPTPEISIEGLVDAAIDKTLDRVLERNLFQAGQAQTTAVAQNLFSKLTGSAGDHPKAPLCRVNITTVAGKRSTVTISQALLSQLAAKNGSTLAATKLVRRAALEVSQSQAWQQPNANMSLLVSEHLAKTAI